MVVLCRTRGYYPLLFSTSLLDQARQKTTAGHIQDRGIPKHDGVLDCWPRTAGKTVRDMDIGGEGVIG